MNDEHNQLRRQRSNQITDHNYSVETTIKTLVGYVTGNEHCAKFRGLNYHYLDTTLKLSMF